MNESIATTEQILQLMKRQNEVVTRVANGNISVEDALSGTQGIIEGIYPNKHSRFAKYNKLLRPLDEQLKQLYEFNSVFMPDNLRAPTEWFSVNSYSDRIQSVNDLTTFFVFWGDVQKTIEYQIALLVLSQPDVRITESFRENLSALMFDESSSLIGITKPGIYRVRLNLVDNWYRTYETAKSVADIRQGAIKESKPLAGLMSLGAFALQDPLLCQSQDGYNFPFIDMSDLCVNSQESCCKSAYFCWEYKFKRVTIGLGSIEVLDETYASPTIII